MHRFESADGFELAYDVAGSGPTVVLVPGALQSRKWWHDAGYVDRLADRFTTISVDPLGHGDSDRPHDPDAYAGDRLVDHLVSVLDAEGIDRCTMWGWSRGASLVSKVASSAPGRVRLAVLGSPPAHGVTFPNELIDALGAGDWGPFLNMAAGMGEPELFSKMTSDNDPVAIGAVFKARGRMEFGRLEVPALTYVGDGERSHRLSSADAQRFGIPMAILPTGEHMATFAAIDQAMALVSPFLDD